MPLTGKERKIIIEQFRSKQITLEILEEKIKNNSEIARIKDLKGNDLLMLAAKMGDEEIIIYLLQKFPSMIKNTNNEDSNALQIAVKKGHQEIIKILQDAPNTQKKSYPSPDEIEQEEKERYALCKEEYNIKDDIGKLWIECDLLEEQLKDHDIELNKKLCEMKLLIELLPEKNDKVICLVKYQSILQQELDEVEKVKNIKIDRVQEKKAKPNLRRGVTFSNLPVEENKTEIEKPYRDRRLNRSGVSQSNLPNLVRDRKTFVEREIETEAPKNKRKLEPTSKLQQIFAEAMSNQETPVKKMKTEEQKSYKLFTNAGLDSKKVRRPLAKSKSESQLKGRTFKR